ncbi:MAG: aminotransferase class V-fold PLP-dependent enzyme [Planctomycetaceae bacterium]
MNRRELLQLAAVGTTFAMKSALAAVKDSSPEEVAADEDFWAQIRNEFTIDRSVLNLNNGHMSPSPRIVQEAQRRYNDSTNMGPFHTMVKQLYPQVETARRRIAEVAGVDPEEIAITRNSSEALEIAQLGVELKPGDEVLTTNQDYGRMLTTFRQRERREGIVLKEISFPVPSPGMDELVRRFEEAITPKTRLILCCHITNLTGQIFPVKRIAALARAHGIPLIVDGAHAFNHFPFKISDLDCDYYGVSLHKWAYAPCGTGFLYVRKSRIKETWALMASDSSQDNNIRKFEAIGTHPASTYNAIPEAIAFNQNIGIERKAARLRYLRDRWANRLGENPKVRIMHSKELDQSAGIGNIGFEGLDVRKVAEELQAKYTIFTAPIVHPEFSGIRITPNIYTEVSEIDYFSDCVEKILKG